MNKKRKVCFVIGYRGNYARVKTVLEAIKDSPVLELSIVLTGGSLLDRYGNITNILKKEGFSITAKTYIIVEGENPVTMAKSTGLAIIELTTIFDAIRPDVIIVVGDRFEGISIAVGASYLNIPLAHVQGGEISGSIDEKIRHAITKFADIHFVANNICKERLIKMGEDPNYVFVTGCPSIDLALKIKNDPKIDFDVYERYPGIGVAPDLSGEYVIVIQNPVTTEYEDSMYQIEQTLFALDELEVPTLWFWPNVDAGSDKISKGIRKFRELHKPKYMHFFKNMAPEDFLRLVYNSKCLIGNSSVLVRECAFFGVPAVLVGSRQKYRDKAENVVEVGYDRKQIKKAILSQMDKRYKSSNLYGDGHAGERIAKILETIDLSITKSLKRIDSLKLVKNE